MLRSKTLNELKSLFNCKSGEGENGELEGMANTKQLPEIKLIKLGNKGAEKHVQQTKYTNNPGP